MRTFILFRAMVVRSFIYLRRYYFETVSGVITIFLFFLLIFYGAKAFGAGAPRFGDTLSAIVVGYFVWTLALFSYSSLSQDVIMEAQLGTLEQMAMSPMGLGKALVADVFAGFVNQLIILSLLLLMMMAASGKWLNIDVFSLIPLLVTTTIGIIGVGFLMAGFAIVFKRVQSIAQIFQIAFIALVAVPISSYPFMKYLPLAWGNHLIGRVMIKGSSIFEIPLADLGFLAATSAAYFVMGYAIFRWFERVARSKALLGHY